MILADKEIKKLILDNNMIFPYEETINVGISSGISSYGFDSKLDNKLFIFDKKLNDNLILDFKDMQEKDCFFHIVESNEFFIIPSYGFVLGKTKEYFKIPNDIFVLYVEKSTYARCDVIVNVTLLEPGWEGFVTLEFSNTSPFPVKLYTNEGVCQCIFFKGKTQFETTYKDKKGKYMNQIDITLHKNKK